MTAFNRTQYIFGVYDPVSGKLLGVTPSGNTPYSAIPGSSAIVSTFAALRLQLGTQVQTVIATGKLSQSDGSGGTFVLNASDTTSGAWFLGTISGTVLTVVSVNNGTLAVGQSVNRGDTGASVGTILSLGTGTGGTGTYNLSASLSILNQITFSADNNSTTLVGIDGSRWNLATTVSALVGPAIYGTDSGAVNAYVFTHSTTDPPATLAVGTVIRLTVLNTNTSSATLNADGTGAVAVIRANGSALTGGELSSLGPVVLQSTGTQWQIVSTAGAQPGFERTAAEIAASVIPPTVGYKLVPGQVDRYFNNTVPGTTDATAGFTAAISQAQQAGGAVITVNSLLAIASSVTIPTGVSMQVLNGNINIAANQTLQINGYFSAPRITCFTGAGIMIFGAGSVGEAYPEWWGAKADSTVFGVGTDNTNAIAAMLLSTSGGNASQVGLVAIRLASGYYMTGGTQYIPAVSQIRGYGRESSGFVAKPGTTGIWWNDAGSGQKIVLEDLVFYCNNAPGNLNCPGMTNGVLLGTSQGGRPWNSSTTYTPGQYVNVATQPYVCILTNTNQTPPNATYWTATTNFHGTEGALSRIWIRDCACSGGTGYFLWVNGNVGWYDHIACYGNNVVGQNLMRISGISNYGSMLAPYGAGANAYALYFDSAASYIDSMEVEAPGTAGTPSTQAVIFINQNSQISGLSLSNADDIVLDHWIELSGNVTNWALTGINYIFHTKATGVVLNGNIKRSDGSYFGGNASGVSAWNSSQTYQIGNIVTSGGNTYRAQAINTNSVPPNANWILYTGPFAHSGEGNFFSETAGLIRQCFTLRIINTSGTLQHFIAEPGDSGTAFAGLINGASAALTTTPTGADASTAMAAGGKIGSGATNTFWLDTPNQAVKYTDASATMVFNSTTTALTCIASIQSININGVTRQRMSLAFQNATTGANFALIPANFNANTNGSFLEVTFSGFMSQGGSTSLGG